MFFEEKRGRRLFNNILKTKISLKKSISEVKSMYVGSCDSCVTWRTIHTIYQLGLITVSKAVFEGNEKKGPSFLLKKIRGRRLFPEKKGAKTFFAITLFNMRGAYGRITQNLLVLDAQA